MDLITATLIRGWFLFFQGQEPELSTEALKARAAELVDGLMPEEYPEQFIVVAIRYGLAPDGWAAAEAV